MNKKSNLLLAVLLAAMLALLLVTGVGIISAQEEGPEELALPAQTPPMTMQTVYDIRR